MLLHVTYDAQEGFLCVTSYCGTLQYSALVNSVFTNTFNFGFGLTLTFVYKHTICMAWRFPFPPRKYDFKSVSLSVSRRSQTAGHNSCSIVSGNVSNCSHRLTVYPVTSSRLNSAYHFFYTRKTFKTIAKTASPTRVDN